MTVTAYLESEGDSFTEWLQSRSEPAWGDATEHRFTTELAADALDDAVYERYLVQDYQFVRTLTATVGHAAAEAPSMDARARLADFLSLVATDENDYFQRSFDALEVPIRARTDPERLPVTQHLSDLFQRAARTGGYAETLAVLVPAEWIYKTWAVCAAEQERPDRFYLAEWIDLHANDEFVAFVDWLCGQLDEVGPKLSPRRQERVEELFTRTVDLEVAFFDAAYE
jgi:thiaminase/transcriptional activator TenA